MPEAPLQQDPAAFYDAVTDAWRYIFGDNFHYGFFSKPDVEELDSATIALIDKLAGLAHIDSGTKILDVGCGVGQPAMHLFDRFACEIIGISTSSRGVSIAVSNAAARRCGDRVRFLQRDAVDSGFADGSFDIVWLMESSHLITDKDKLFREAVRMLRRGGRILLSDVILRRPVTLAELYRESESFDALDGGFGPAKCETLAQYQARLSQAGFEAVSTEDISEPCFPTLRHWQQNMARHEARIASAFTEERFATFRRACGILADFFRRGIIGYGLVSATKPLHWGEDSPGHGRTIGN